MSTATQLDLVGTAGAAKILGMIVGSVSRLYSEGKLPTACAEIEGLTPVWHRADIEAYARGETARKNVRPLPLISTAGAARLIAELTGREKLDKSQIGRWRRAGAFPEPAYELEAGKTTYPLWWEQSVRDHAESL